jgi:hypothetical protein
MKKLFILFALTVFLSSCHKEDFSRKNSGRDFECGTTSTRSGENNSNTDSSNPIPNGVINSPDPIDPKAGPGEDDENGITDPMKKKDRKMN